MGDWLSYKIVQSLIERGIEMLPVNPRENPGLAHGNYFAGRKGSHKSLNVFVIGAGVVGKATGKGLITKGNRVTFVDVSPKVITELSTSGFEAYSWESLQKRFDAMSLTNPHNDYDYDSFPPDIVMFTVSTPYVEDGASQIQGLNLEYFEAAVKQYAELMRDISKYHILVFRSTITPGTTRRLIQEIEDISSKVVGKDFGVCMQPEFLRAKSSEEDFLNPWLTVIGEFDERSGDFLESLYKGWSGEIIRTDLETAEFMKMVHNSFNAVKISFANEMWIIGKLLGIDANKALHLASLSSEGYWNPAYGITGGRPYGGACLPKDVKGFISFLARKNINPEMLMATDGTNKKLEEMANRSIAEKPIAHGPNWAQSPATVLPRRQAKLSEKLASD